MTDTADGPLSPERLAEIGRRAEQYVEESRECHRDDLPYAESYAKDVAALIAEVERLRDVEQKWLDAS